MRGQLLSLQSPTEKLWLSVSSSPVRGPDGRVAMVVSSITDVTRLHELQEQQDDLMRTISHDLRAPLSALQLQAQILQRGLDPADPSVRRVDSILVNSERITAMIRDLVEVARLESGQIDLQLQRIELPTFARELTARMAGTLDTARVRIEVAEPLPAIRADPDRLERIVIQPPLQRSEVLPGGQRGELSLEPRGESVCLSVRDRGMGISPEEMPHLFERFFRSKSSARMTEGLGLGLYITSLLVKAHGGTLCVEAELGKGSVFRAFLPADAAAR